jgi:hypothetical protein
VAELQRTFMPSWNTGAPSWCRQVSYVNNAREGKEEKRLKHQSEKRN